jgi:hypothetical protein
MSQSVNINVNNLVTVALFVDRVIHISYYLITHFFCHRVNKVTGFLIQLKAETYLIKLSPRLGEVS